MTGLTAAYALMAGANIGLTDTLSLDVEYRFRDILASGANPMEHQLLTGLRYNLDVIEWVPHFGVAFGYYRFSAGPLPDERFRNELGFEAEVGIDYLFSREVGAGVKLAYHGFLLDPPSSLGNTPMLVALLAVERRWGW